MRERLWARAETIMRTVSPRHRRWDALLASLTLDPDAMTLPVEDPPPSSFIICGSPRSGTSLVAAALFQPPMVVTVMEPWDAFRLPPSELFGGLRHEIQQLGELRRGRLDIEELKQTGAVRWVRDGEKPTTLRVQDDFLLGVKMPAFWRYLPLLPNTRFIVCIREPTETIESYVRKGGRLGVGLDYDVPFNRAMNATLGEIANESERQVAMYDYIYERIIPFLDRPNVHTVRYEDWHEDADGVLVDLGAFLGCDLSSSSVTIDAPRALKPDGHVAPQLVRQPRCAAVLGYSMPEGNAL